MFICDIEIYINAPHYIHYLCSDERVLIHNCQMQWSKIEPNHEYLLLKIPTLTYRHSRQESPTGGAARRDFEYRQFQRISEHLEVHFLYRMPTFSALQTKINVIENVSQSN